MSDKGDFLRTKAEAKAIAYPAQAQLIHSTADAASGVIDSTKGLADSSLKLIGEVKSPRLSIVA